MFARLASVFAVLLILASAQAQDLKSITRHYKPNDSLRYQVEFEGDPKFDNVNLGFYLQGSVLPDQPGFQTYFAIGRITRIGPGVYDVEGTVPENAATGTYQIQRVNASLGPASKEYDTSGLKLTIQVDNDSKYSFPPLKSISQE